MFRWLIGSSLRSKSDVLEGFAAALAFHFALALMPFLIVAFTISSQLHVSHLRSATRELLERVFPLDSIQFIDALAVAAEAHTGHGLIPATFVFALWSSGTLMLTASRTMHFILDERPASFWSGWRNRWNASLLVILWLCALFAGSLVIIIGPYLESTLHDLKVSNPYIWTGWKTARHLFLLFVLGGSFYLTYAIIPRRKLPKPALWQAAWIAALGWSLVTFVFSQVLPGVWKANLFYGALSGIVITLLWAYAGAWAFILGACRAAASRPPG
jgi:YihY family inner membrane protein